MHVYAVIIICIGQQTGNSSSGAYRVAKRRSNRQQMNVHNDVSKSFRRQLRGNIAQIEHGVMITGAFSPYNRHSGNNSGKK